MGKYIFAYSVYAWTKRNPSVSVPCGGAFYSYGARDVMKRTQENGFRVSELRISMFDATKPLDWNHPLSERHFSFS